MLIWGSGGREQTCHSSTSKVEGASSASTRPEKPQGKCAVLAKEGRGNTQGTTALS